MALRPVTLVAAMFVCACFVASQTVPIAQGQQPSSGIQSVPDSAGLGAPVRVGSVIPPEEKPSPTLSKAQIEKIVQDYLKVEAEKKASSEKQKKEAADKEGHVVGGDLSMKGSWGDQGLTFQTPNKDFKIHVGGRFTVDTAWFEAGNEIQYGPGGLGTLRDGSDFRRGRVRVEGTIYENINFISEYAFDSAIEGNTTQPGFIDVFGEITQLPWIGNFRAGHFREPFSLEALSSGNGLPLMERSAAFDAFVPFRNTGMMIWDTALNERMTWATGLFRTNSRNTGNPFDYGDGEYSSTSRVTALPWFDETCRGALHLGAAYSHRNFLRNSTQEQARFRSFPEIRVNRVIVADTGTLNVDDTDLVGLEFAFKLGPFLLQSDYYHAWVRDALVGNQFTQPRFHGGYIQASYMLTGESRVYNKRSGTFDRARPFENFFFVRNADGPSRFCLGKGSWEIALRYTHVDVNDPGQGINAQTINDCALGLTWQLNPHTRVQWNYVVLHRDFPSAPNEGLMQIFAMRYHMEF